MIVRIGELKADHQSLSTRNEQEKSRVQNVEDAQALMVDRHDPPMKLLKERAPL
jgi:hypothetical protein